MTSTSVTHILLLDSHILFFSLIFLGGDPSEFVRTSLCHLNARRFRISCCVAQCQSLFSYKSALTRSHAVRSPRRTDQKLHVVVESREWIPHRHFIYFFVWHDRKVFRAMVFMFFLFHFLLSSTSSARQLCCVMGSSLLFFSLQIGLPSLSRRMSEGRWRKKICAIIPGAMNLPLHLSHASNSAMRIR